MLSLLDRLTEISLVRTRAHFKNAVDHFLEENQSESPGETGVSYLVAVKFLAERTCYTAGAISCLLRNGFADSAYELWRTMFNLELNISDIDQSQEPEHAAARYLSAAMEELYRHETKLSDAGLPNLIDPEDLKNSVEKLRDEYPDIEKQDGWIANKADRKVQNRAELAGMPFEYFWSYDLASKSVHGAAISTLKRPSVYFPRGRGELPPVEQSVRGIEEPALLAARSLCSVVGRFVYGTSQPELPEEEQWERACKEIYRMLTDMFSSRTGQDDSTPG